MHFQNMQMTCGKQEQKKKSLIWVFICLEILTGTSLLLCSFRCVAFCPVKILYRDDQSKRGVERTCSRVISKTTPAAPTVLVSPSAEVWRNVCSIRHTSQRTFWICSSSLEEKNRFNLFEVFMMLIFFFFYLASLRILPASRCAHFLRFVFPFWAALNKPSWKFAMKFQWMCSSKVNHKFAVSYNMFNTKS